jgi:formamidopyrimidine-DNA glycosylase
VSCSTIVQTLGSIFHPNHKIQNFPSSHVRKLIKRHPKKPLKALLLDQNACPGIGNWMADEICWRLGIHPGNATGTLESCNASQRDPLCKLRIPQTCSLKKTPPPHPMVSPPAATLLTCPRKTGFFQHRWKKGGTCPKCKTALARDTIASRTTAWCPNCQS